MRTRIMVVVALALLVVLAILVVTTWTDGGLVTPGQPGADLAST